jgi:glucosamine-6-phosphate deaminase
VNIEAELERYVKLLQEYQPVACVLGIGENGHLAFNDPPADFKAKDDLQIVNLAETARQQQVGEGHFASLADVPKQAITLTIPSLLRPRHVLAVVPENRKAPAVKAALEGPISPDCPASILRLQDHVTLYLDRESATLIDLPG